MRNIAFFVTTIVFIVFNVRADDVLSQRVPNKNLTQDYFADISDISGTWNPISLDYGSTSLINLARVIDKSQTVSLTFFPIEYCQAIRICLPPYEEFSAEYPFVVNETMCDSNLLYIPPTGKLTYYNKTEDTYTCFTNTLTFRGGKNSHSLSCAPTAFSRTALYKPEKASKQFIENKLLIVMSNSRQCQVNIVIDGKLEYSDMLIKARTKDTTKLPSLFHYGGSIDALPTFYTKTSAEGKRSQDFLPLLKSLTKTSKTLKNVEFKCLVGFGIGNGFSPIFKPSIIHIKKQKFIQPNSADLPKIERIMIETERCHWLRLWFTEKDTTWDKYASKIETEVHQTIDLFFTEGFALLPDRENSIHLPGGSKDIESIGIYHHGEGLAEISFGSINNKRINSIHFQMEILKKDDYEMFLIRSPHCDANIGSDLVGDGMFTNAKKVWNPVLIKECNAYSIEKP